jgi:glycosyltransferase involved in cell wall biosynthesis
MKILVCNTLEKKGGAARSANRIVSCLKQDGLDTDFCYLYKDSQESKSLIPKIDAIPKLLFSKRRKTPFSSSIFSFGKKNFVKKYNPDILHLNYINMGMFSIKDIGNFKMPIVWTLHDSWTFTGGCHLPNDCERYTSRCGQCPALGSKKDSDLSRYIFSKKERYWNGKNITLVCPSKWMYENAKRSKLFENSDIQLIPNPIDTSIFKPKDKIEARKKYNLDLNKKYILFGSVDPLKDKNKGFELLKEALENLKLQDVELIVFGTDEKEIEINIPVKSVGYIQKEEDMASLYSAADITVLTSRSENLPNVLIESLACGTPCVGFRVGGIPEILAEEDFGEIAEPFDSKSLSSAIQRVLSKDISSKRNSLHEKIEKIYGYKAVSKKYKELYEKILSC